MNKSRGIALFVGLCLPLLLAGVSTPTPTFGAQAQEKSRVVEIRAKRFGFSPNLVTLKKGEPVTLRLTSDDVTHGFYMKALKLDEVIVPGTATEVTITPQTAGRFTTICDHFCGAGHGNMSMTIAVE